MSVVAPLHPPLNNHALDIQNSIKNNFQNHVNDYTPINTYVPPKAGSNSNTNFQSQVANQVANNRPNSVVAKPSGGFRIRLYWERGYNWQNSSSEKFYCLQVAGRVNHRPRSKLIHVSITVYVKSFGQWARRSVQHPIHHYA